MVFSDLFFIFAFLPLFLGSYMSANFADSRFGAGSGRPTQFRNAVLVLFSLLFYAWGEPVYVFLMLGSVLVNFFAGRLIDSSVNHRRSALVAGLIANVLILAVFKYAGFIARTFCSIGIPVAVPDIALPIGISFYTFQSISYLIDVYRREAPAQRRYADLLLYISMFPQLIAGPIVRYDIVALQIADRRATRLDIADGIYRFFIGLGKKVILANQFSVIADQFLAADMAHASMSGAWTGIAAFTLQIFFDFSGYSDMAIGLGRMLGFHFAENFRHPYCCLTVTEFWRRWHISLGSFFRDYVYIPLGGNRRHQAFNILCVWMLTGLWHGASWNFVLWGLYFGIIVMVEKYTLLKVSGRIPALVLHVYSMLLVVAGWGIFYFEDFGQMLMFFRALTGNTATLWDFAAESAVLSHFWLFVAGIVMCMPVYDTVRSAFLRLFPCSTALRKNISLATRLVVSVGLFILCVSLLVGATNNPFIYTRF